MTKQKTLIMGAGAVGILGLLWAVSATRGKDDGSVGGGGGGGGYSMPFVDVEKGSEKTAGTGPASYQIAFPDVTIPTMPQPTCGFMGGETYTPTESMPAALPKDTSKMEAGTYSVGETGKTVTVKEPFTGAPTTISDLAPSAGGGGFGGGGAGGRGDTSSKKETISGSSWFDDVIGGIGNAIGGFFGW